MKGESYEGILSLGFWKVSGVISKIGNMGKGAALGEMTMSLDFLINACFLMGVLVVSKWDVSFWEQGSNISILYFW